MARGTDDDALAWDGDDDPTLDVGTVPGADAPTVAASTSDAPNVDAYSAAPSVVAPSDAVDTVDAAPRALPDGYTALGKGSDQVGAIDRDGAVTMPGERQSMGNATLISLGVLSGVYLLYSIGWLIGANRLSLIAQLFLDPIAFHVTLWIAVLAPLIWFVTAVVLTRGGRSWARFVVLAVGVVVLIPWPFVLAGAAL